MDDPDIKAVQEKLHDQSFSHKNPLKLTGTVDDWS